MKKVGKVIAFFLLLVNFLNFGIAQAETQKKIQSGDLEYLGAFRLPRGENGDPDGFSFGGTPIAFNSKNSSLFVGTKTSGLAEVSTPIPSKSSNIEELPFATIVQNINPNPTEGGIAALPQSSIRGLLVKGDKLYGTSNIYYDANNSARVSHFTRSTDLSKASATAFKTVWQAEKSGYVSGWLAQVPSAWQSALGGDVISGNCCVPIVSRTSVGPAAFAWDTSTYDKSSTVFATPLLYYTGDNAALGPWDGSNPIYGGTTTIGGMVIPEGTSSLLYFGMNGTGTFCYGIGGASGGECVDPLASDKGQHAYPYNNQVWAYDLNDLAQVRAGNKQPWEVKPYAVWSLKDFPVVATVGIGGVAYDSANQLIYISNLREDTDGYSSRALIHVYKVKNASGASSTPSSSSSSSSASTKTSSPSSSSSSSTHHSSEVSGKISSSKTDAPSAPAEKPTAATQAKFNFTRNLTLGSRGSDVTELQNFLIYGGFLKVGATGYFGSLTRRALAMFQKMKGLPSTGFFGPLSRGVLNS